LTDDGILPWPVLIDANTQRAVGRAFAQLGADVVYVTDIFAEKTEDSAIDRWAQSEGRIIVGHDVNFMRAIQQNSFQFNVSVQSGYGRVMLCGRYADQAARLRQVATFLSVCHQWAVEQDNRFLVSIGDNWVRFDDGPLRRTPPRSRPRPGTTSGT
jgi:hypothetical protein